MKECFSYFKNDRDHLELKVSAGRIILKYEKKKVSSSAFARTNISNWFMTVENVLYREVIRFLQILQHQNVKLIRQCDDCNN